jgi:hypothetical protein
VEVLNPALQQVYFAVGFVGNEEGEDYACDLHDIEEAQGLCMGQVI